MRTILIILGLSGCATPLGKLGVDTGYEGTAGGFLGGEEGDVGGPGDDCMGDGVLDCNLDCWVADAKAYIGDRTCDTGQRGPDFDCELMNFDDGDCVEPDPDSEPDTDDPSEDDDASSDETTDDGGDDADAGGSDAGETGDTGDTDDTDESVGETGGTGTAGPTDGGSIDAGSTDSDATGTEGTGGDETGTDGAPTDPVDPAGGGTTDGGGSSGGSADGTFYDGPAVGDDCVAMEEWTLPGLEIDFLGYTYPAEGRTSAGSPGYRDCDLVCVPLEVFDGYVSAGLLSTYVFPSWLADDFCDAGEYGADFYCEYYMWDYGDCDASDDGALGGSTGGTSGGTTGGDGSPLAGESCLTPEGFDGTRDCSGDCYAYDLEGAVGDSVCDDGLSGMGTALTSTYINLLCAEFRYDDGDCGLSAGSGGGAGVFVSEM